MKDGKERKTVTLDADLVAELDEKTDNNSALVNRLLHEYFKAGGTGPVGSEMRLRDVEKRIDQAMTERDRINRRIERLRNEKQRIEEEMADKREHRHEQLEEAAQYVRGKDPDNLAVQNWAEKLGLTPAELLRAVDEDLSPEVSD